MKIPKSLIFLLIILSCITHVSAQKDETERNLFYDAEYFLISEDYQDALPSYLNLHQNSLQNANLSYRIGLCYLNIDGKKTQSIPYLKKACKQISNKYTESHFSETHAPPEALFLLATAYQINNNLDSAVFTFERYKTYLSEKDVYELDFVDHQIKSCATAKRFMQEPELIVSRVLDEIIPQFKANFNPVMSADESIIVYSTKEKFYDAIWMVQKTGKKWSNPINITPQILSDGDTYPTSITADGKTLYLIRINNFGADIFVSKYKSGVWTAMKKLSKKVNSKYFETHAAVSPDGQTIYFTSNRKGGFGGIDIYRTTKDAKSNWQEPVNLGNTINTKFNEHTPFILSDNKTLYFSSQGHMGMGGFDVYKSTYLGEENWSAPQNMGYPWNTTDDNIFLYPIENGEKALYAGVIDKNEGRAQIKELSYKKKETEISKKVLLKGILSFQDNRKVSEGLTLTAANEEGSLISEKLSLDTDNGSYHILLPPGNYTLTASAENYETRREMIKIDENFSRSEMIINISLQPIEVSSGEYIVIKNILFDFDSFALNKNARLEIERLFQIMVKYPKLYIEIIGHTDSKGSADYNFSLSEKRALSVNQYLKDKGIDPIRFISKGAGELESIALNQHANGKDNPEGRKHNRNVSIKILNSPNKNFIVEPIQVPDYLKPSNQASYTILLARSDQKIESDYFKEINSIVSNGAKEQYLNSIYLYTLGQFYSYTQAEEIIKSKHFLKFNQARVININNIEGFTSPLSTISNSSSEKYSIQIAALKNPSNLKQFRNRNNIKIHKCKDSFYRVIYGNYPDRNEANTAIIELKSTYPNAFIIDLSLFMKQLQPLRSSEHLESNKYTIQIEALKTQIGKNYFEGLHDVREIKGDDGVFRYIYGEYTDIEKAKKALLEIKNYGYDDAFIKVLNKISGL